MLLTACLFEDRKHNENKRKWTKQAGEAMSTKMYLILILSECVGGVGGI